MTFEQVGKRRQFQKSLIFQLTLFSFTPPHTRRQEGEEGMKGEEEGEEGMKGE